LNEFLQFKFKLLSANSVLKGGLRIVHHDAAEEIKDVNQALKKGRGRPRKTEENRGGNHQRAIFPGPGKGSVPDTRVRRCLGPEGNGVSSGGEGEGGPGPPNKEGDKQSTPSEEGGNMEQEEEGRTSQA
jgi:hypothetical protein